MPPHWWVPISSSSCSERRKELRERLGSQNVKHVWGSKRHSRCYAVVSGSLDEIQDLIQGEPIQLVDDELEEP